MLRREGIIGEYQDKISRPRGDPSTEPKREAEPKKNTCKIKKREEEVRINAKDLLAQKKRWAS